MALIKKARYAQNPLVLELVLNATDTMVDTTGVTKAIGAGGVFDFADLPPNAQVIGGDAVAETAFSGGGITAMTAAIGDSVDADRYAAAESVLAAGARVPVIPTGYSSQGEPARLTLAATGGTATAGKLRVRLEYIVEGRANENI